MSTAISLTNFPITPYQLPFDKSVFSTTAQRSISKKIYIASLPCIQALTALYYCGRGLCEISNSINLTKVSFGKTSLKVAIDRLHGILLLSKGLVDGLEVYQNLAKKSIVKHISVLRFYGGGCFFLANCIELSKNIKKYRKARANRNVTETKFARLGIWSNIGYMGATALAMFSRTSSLGLILSAVATMANALSIVYRFLTRRQWIMDSQ